MPELNAVDPVPEERRSHFNQRDVVVPVGEVADDLIPLIQDCRPL